MTTKQQDRIQFLSARALAILDDQDCEVKAIFEEIWLLSAVDKREQEQAEPTVFKPPRHPWLVQRGQP